MSITKTLISSWETKIEVTSNPQGLTITTLDNQEVVSKSETMIKTNLSTDRNQETDPVIQQESQAKIALVTTKIIPAAEEETI